MSAELWEQARNALVEVIGRNNVLAWIEPLIFAGVRDGVAMLDAPTTFIADWVARNFAEHIRAALALQGLAVNRVEFAVRGGRGGKPAAPAPSLPSEAAAPPRTPLPARPRAADDEPLPGAPLLARYTFDSFVVGKPNALAHAAARRVAEQDEVSFNPLFLYGGVGLGKTHLMHAIAWELLRRRPESKVVYISAEKFMFAFINALRTKTVMEFKSLFRSVDVLLIDDVHFIAGKDSTQEEFFHTFNALVDLKRQIVLSADRAPGEIKDLEARITTRLQCGLVVDLHPTDYELRLGILQNRIDGFREQYSGVTIGRGVIEFLAHSLHTNVRVLEGAMNRLCAFAQLVGREITIELAQDCLADMLRSLNRRITIEEIQKKVAEHYNVRFADLIGPKRVRTLARPRQVAMYLCKELTSRSLPEIGRRFGGRDHTTIMHGVRRVEELRRTDPQIAEDVEMLRRVLQT
ncbi:MAG: chromosomal replication initiator protein DnaA [Rhodobacteraceae bacterium]|jgi:chromosomal replication initiator protein|nr:chromosomal replication initiator protein DnaA [Paracoccaceae bacterium]